ncbi:MAG: type II secretion system major pseudopilin GspG [Phycisphaerae bacterium]|nr:type II secretion system major pseudopilin GspG [Phycisphaerae bacterium]
MRRVLRKRGFTLMEILLVVGILALLAAFVVPSLISAGDQARIDIAKAAIGGNGIIATALSRYRMDVGQFPETDEGLAALFEKPSSIDEEREGEIWKGPYLEGSPEDLRDPWKREYQYKSPGDVNEKSYDLWSLGPNEKDDDDDIKNWREK